MTLLMITSYNLYFFSYTLSKRLCCVTTYKIFYIGRPAGAPEVNLTAYALILTNKQI